MSRRPRAPQHDTREHILAVARALFHERPTTTPTLADLAQRAGVSRATLHRHFRSRQDLLREVNVQPEPGARARALAAALELLARDGLAQLSMDELAERAGISRANLYRLFPGKAALFRELVRLYSPLEPIGATVTELRNESPDIVVPAIARAVARHLGNRVGLVRSLLFEVSAPSSDAAAARELAIEAALGPLTSYLLAQMAAGRLRRMHPLLAIQAFAGPIIFHLLLRPFAETLLGFDLPIEDAVEQLARTWVLGMQPDKPKKER